MQYAFPNGNSTASDSDSTALISEATVDRSTLRSRSDCTIERRLQQTLLRSCQRILLATLCLCVYSCTARAAFLHEAPVSVRQPDGTILHCYASGDEFYNWLHDREGFTIVQDPQSGYYMYATLSCDRLVATSSRPGRDDPAILGLRPRMNIPVQVEEEIRASQHHNMPSDVVSGPRAGTFCNIVIFVRCSDDPEFADPMSKYSDGFNGNTQGVSSVYNYIREVSYGRLDVLTTFYPANAGASVLSYQDIRPRAYYLPYSVANPMGYPDAERYTRERELTDRALLAIAGQIPSGLVLDGDGDGYVDNVCFILPGAPYARGTFLYPHMSSMGTYGPTIGNKKVRFFNIHIETWANVGVIVHEMMHSLGAPDLYRYSTTYVDPIGRWDIMADNRVIPQFTGAWLRHKYLGWIDTIPRITASGRYALRPLSSPSRNCFRIDSPVEGECFILEYRKRTSIFESAIPGEGLLVYRVDSLLRGNADGPPDEVYLYRPGGNPNLGYAMEGTLDSAAFGTGSRTAINATTDPACLLSSGLPGNLDLSEIRMMGDSVTFTVNLASLGAPWDRMSITSSGALTGIAFPTSTTGWMVGDQGAARSTDAGETWSVVSSRLSEAAFGMSAWDLLRCWVIGSSTIYRTSDGGASWDSARVTMPAGGRLYAILMLSSTVGWVAGSGGVLYRTDDGGATWTLTPSGTSRTLRCVSFVDPSRGWAVGEHGTMASTWDSGATWSAFTFADTLGLHSMMFVDDQTGYLVGSKGRVYRTTNGGDVWIPHHDVPTRADLYAVTFSGRDSGWAVGERGTIIRTTDGGSTWKTMVSGTIWALNAIAVVNTEKQLIVGDGGTVLRNPASVLTDATPSGGRGVLGFMLEQNFPNPFNPATTIQFTLGERTVVRISVFNLLGQEVATIFEGTLDAGTYTRPFDGSRIASGAYVCRIRARAFQATRKMLLIR